MNVVMITQVDDQEPWAKNSRFKNGERDLSGNIQRQWEEVTTNDWAITTMFLDVQYDRGRTDAMAETPMLSITEAREDDIVVIGWKEIGTARPLENQIQAGELNTHGHTP